MRRNKLPVARGYLCFRAYIRSLYITGMNSQPCEYFSNVAYGNGTMKNGNIATPYESLVKRACKMSENTRERERKAGCSPSFAYKSDSVNAKGLIPHKVRRRRRRRRKVKYRFVHRSPGTGTSGHGRVQSSFETLYRAPILLLHRHIHLFDGPIPLLLDVILSNSTTATFFTFLLSAKLTRKYKHEKALHKGVVCSRKRYLRKVFFSISVDGIFLLLLILSHLNRSLLLHCSFARYRWKNVKRKILIRKPIDRLVGKPSMSVSINSTRK